MKIDKYPVIVGATSMVYEFISEGIKGKISKLVIPNIISLQANVCWLTS